MNQMCIVHNKTQLIAAIGCAFDFYGVTGIILKRKHGNTKMFFSPDTLPHRHSTRPYVMSSKRREKFNKRLRRVIAIIRKTPAECFR